MTSLPKPYFDDGHVTLYNGDSRLIAPLLPPPDITCTDPPYGMAYQSNHRVSVPKFEKIEGDAEAYDVEFLRFLIGRSKSATFAFMRWDNLWEIVAAKLEPKSVIAWVKNNWSMGDLEHEFGRQWEACAYWAGAEHKWANGRPADVIQRDRVPPLDMIHPTEKPVALLTQILESCTGNLVFDPYAGSCSTLVAARLVGKKAIGIEMEERYCALAVERLKQGCLF